MKKQKSGYITVYLSLMLGIMMGLFLIILEGVRMHTIRLETECVTDMAMDSCLAEYHRELLEQYDLFFIDTSYGTKYPSIARTENHLLTYMNSNFQPEKYLNIPRGKNLTDLHAKDAEILFATIASDQDGLPWKRQAVRYVKNKLGIGLMKRAASYKETMEENGWDKRDVELEWRQAQKEMNEAIEQRRQQWEKEMEEAGEEGKEFPEDTGLSLKEIWDSREEGILGLALSGENRQLSTVKIPVEELASHRRLLVGSGVPQWQSKADGVLDKGLLVTYFMEKCGRYGNPKETSKMSYQLEYLLHGEDRDLDNLRQTAEQILWFRQAANASYLFSDSQKKGQAEAAASAAAFILMTPELKEVITPVILFSWSYAESVKDVRMLLDGKKIAVVKDSESWNTPFYHLLTFKAHLGEYKECESGMDYEDFLAMFLLMKKENMLSWRMEDIMEWDIRNTPGNSNFRIDGCIANIRAKIAVTSGYGYEYEIDRYYQYE